MTALRKRLGHYAAIVLLAWLFAFGASIAQDCDDHIHAGTEDCCTTLQASAMRPEASAEAALPAPTSLAWFTASERTPLPLPAAGETASTSLQGPPWNDSGQSIPILFLRLAL